MSLHLGLPLSVREKELADLKQNPSFRKYDLRFQSKLRPFDVYTVRLELPKYRLENGRTRAAQQDYVAKHKLPKDFFDPSRCENDEVQAAQHEILKGMAAHTEPERNLFKFFERRDQEQPLILDHLGFVVNGNRRLCTYREIHARPGETRFAHIDVIILPKCDPKDIDELEAHLQVEPDIKQEYGWVSLALTLREKLHSKQYTEDQLSGIYELSKKEIQTKLAQLTLAEEYLASRKKEGRYLELEKTEFAFDQLLKNRAKLGAAPGKQQLLSEIAFRLIDSPEGGRVYASISDAREALPHIKAALEKELVNEAPSQIRPVSNDLDADLFGSAQLSEGETAYARAFQALRVAENDDAVYAIIQNEIEAKRERERAARRGNSALEAIRKANTSLAEAVTVLTAQVSKQGIAEQIESIDLSIAKIREWLGKSDA
jgi:hypothetical protein